MISYWDGKGEMDRPGKRTLCHTFHSLATGPLEAVRNGDSWWTPTRPGVNPQPAPDAPAPGKTAAQRLAQMREIARNFTVTQSRDGAEMKEVELRLLPQPIYRYEAGPDDGARDGAIFAYLHDWDPEILLLIESRDTKDGPRWHYAPLRFCYLSARVKYKDREVWSYQKGGPMTDRQHYYLLLAFYRPLVNPNGFIPLGAVLCHLVQLGLMGAIFQRQAGAVHPPRD